MTPSGDIARGALRVLCVVVAVFAAATAACSELDGRRVPAHVVRVSDGDTLVARLATVTRGLKHEEKVRLVGLDCPESAQRGGPSATARLAALVLGRPVILEIALHSRDRYGRLLAGVYLADGKTLVQELLVREGFCRTLVILPNVESSSSCVPQRRKRSAPRVASGLGLRGLTENPVDSPHGHR